MRHDTTQTAIMDLSGSLADSMGGDCYDCATELLNFASILGQTRQEAEDDIILLTKQIISSRKAEHCRDIKTAQETFKTAQDRLAILIK